MISFDQSFRRGFLGTILVYLSKTFNFDPVYLILFICSLSLIVFLYKLNKLLKFNFSSLTYYSPFLIGFLFINSLWLRKDVLILLGFIFFVEYIKVKTFQTILIIVFMSLIHEMFILITFPVIIIDYFKKRDEKKFLILISFWLITSIFLFIKNQYVLKTYTNWNEILVGYNHGLISGESGPFRYLNTNALEIIKSFSNIYIPYFYHFLFYLSVLIVTLNSFFCDLNRKSFISYFLIMSLSISPLFIVGYDYGRWIYFIVVTSLILTINYPPLDLFPQFFNKKVENNSVFKNIIYMSFFIPFLGMTYVTLSNLLYHSLFGRVFYFLVNNFEIKDTIKNILNGI